jgi:hypothetical protein
LAIIGFSAQRTARGIGCGIDGRGHAT